MSDYSVISIRLVLHLYHPASERQHNKLRLFYIDGGLYVSRRHERPNADPEVHSKKKPLKPAPDSDQYKRGSKYVRTSEPSTDLPLFVEDNHIGTGYFSDASNSVLRRASVPKEPAQTYMAPVETRRKTTDSLSDDEGDQKHKKHSHKKKKSKRGHKKHHSKEEKRKRFNKISSAERENIVSLEDSSVVGS